MSQTQSVNIADIAARTHYPVDAFHFIRRGLDFTVRQQRPDVDKLSARQRHVSGQELSHGLRDYAVREYGPLARTVLLRWRITRTEDFGQIVFAMVNAGLMQATEGDSIRDFDNGFGFDEAFGVPVSLDRISPDGRVLESAQEK